MIRGGREEGGSMTVAEADLERSFRAAFAGTVITPEDDRYDAARAVWNGTVDARPALIAQCHAAGDIVAAGNLVLGGGGENLGVVGKFVCALHPVRAVLGGLMVFPLERGKGVLTAFRDWAAGLPEEASMLAAIITAPPEPFVPPGLAGHKVVAIFGCRCGDMDARPAGPEPPR